jgi:fermentation-respiration switch protein FrsA (DUF1100 family)
MASAPPAATHLPLWPVTTARVKAVGTVSAADIARNLRFGGDGASDSAVAWASIDQMAIFDAFAPILLIAPRPLFMVVGSRAVTSWMSIDAFQRATGPKGLHWIAGASHNDLYDKEQYVGPAVDKLAEFFAANLTAVPVEVGAA